VPAKPPVYVYLLPSLIPPGALRGGTAIVIDVLRATTVMVHALAAGCEAIVPCLEIEQAREMAASLGRDRTILAGERRGEPIEGFDLGNSPSSFTPEVCAGKTVVMTTTNGTKAIQACLEAERVLVAGFVNFGATSMALRREDRPIHFVCSGTDGEVSLEDTLLAAAFVQSAVVSNRDWGNDAAIIAMLASRNIVPLGVSDFGSLIEMGRGGRRNLELGLAADIADAACWNRFDIVAELLRDPIRIVKSP
jgi:2-phosphosulfolactate phosphatase